MRMNNAFLVLNGIFIVLFPLGSPSANAAEEQFSRKSLPIKQALPPAVANKTLAGSKAEFPQPVRAPGSAPNILLVLLDDAGFGQSSTFGGPVQTPTYDHLAANGLKFNRFHVTGLCSPTRAALLSGRNHHAMGFGSITELGTGWPGYTSLWPRESASIARVLQENGYSTSAFGKWHLTPDRQQGPAGPFDRWPNALGFDYFWGFLGAEASQYHPIITENNTTIGVPTEKDFYFPDAMTRQAVKWLRGQQSQSPEKPFFLYFSPGATHAPHHVPKEWSAKYKGKFDQGWDKLREEVFARQKKLGVIPENAVLTPRDPAFPDWDKLPKVQQALYARQMEVFAGFLENADYQVGQVLKEIEKLGQLDNTLVIYIFGDNGASMEGSPTGTFNEITSLIGVPLTPPQQLMMTVMHGGPKAWGGPTTNPHYASAWAWAGNTPFPWGKQIASHLGGIRSPLVVSWPKRIKDKGGLRSQFTHVTDIVPTILEVAGLPAPTDVDGIAQNPIHGTSFAFSFDDAEAKSRHNVQYFTILGNRSIYKDGWLLSARIPKLPWDSAPATLNRFAPGAWNPDADPVELYNLDEDFSQSKDLSKAYPDKVAELKQLYLEEAEKNHVFPLLAEYSAFFGVLPPENRTGRFIYQPGVENVAPGMIPSLYTHSYVISADIEVPEAGAEGVIVAEGSQMGGFALHVDEGKLRHTYSFYGLRTDVLESPKPLPKGKVNVRFEFVADEPGKQATGGKTSLIVNGETVAQGKFDHSIAFRFSLYEGLDIGRDNGMAVSKTYENKGSFPFSGKIDKVEFEVK
jgi:arylsulfatase